MAITVDYSVQPYVIEFKQADLTLVSGTRYEITVDYMWQLLREYSDGSEGMAYPITYRRIPSTASTPAITEINDPIFNAQFEDGAYSVDIINGNTNFRDVEVKNQVSVGTNNTTGFINPTFLEAGLFNNVVTIDVINGFSGTDYTAAGGIIGTVQTPSNNTTDSLTIAANRGFNELAIIGDLTVDSGSNYTDFVFTGQGQNLSTLTITSAAIVNNCTFREATITGTLDGDSHLENCIIDNVSFISGVIENCILNSATITLGGSATAHFVNCASGVPGATTPTINMGGSGQALAMRAYSGGVKLTNKTGADKVSIDLVSGQVRIDQTTVTNGEIVVRGVGKVVDDATGDEMPSGTYTSMTLINETVGTQTLDQIWDYDLSGSQTADTSGDLLKKAKINAQNAFAVSS